MLEVMTRLETEVDALNTKMDVLISLLGGASTVRLSPAERRVSRDGKVRLPRLTPKQHATLQMVVRGASNIEIAERLGVTVNTAKVHVRTLFGKFGTRDREHLAVLGKEALGAVGADEYKLLSGGLPKDWDATFSELMDEDPCKPLYWSGDPDG